ncbi:MAG: A/G-specific adenine glycosylase [Bacteroidales bacterium]|nr:A/G-specific adenine glycosylase [Bacteroidales bacterium]MBN2819327.1 A/G-specific adenine glycosylase [Bacteroidales bacterium]
MLFILLNWYNNHKRELPWRNTKDPYKIWLSEIILQQTRVDQGLEYYNRFVQRFPSVSSLASAELEEIFLLWQGLGYYSRARNLHVAAKQIVVDFNGEFPGNSILLKKLKGVGDYTAAAVASFAFGEAIPVVDGNVFRVLSRLYANETAIDTAKGKIVFTELADKTLNKKQPDIHNQAMMELGALVCLPKSPKCPICPLQDICEACKLGIQEKLPVKKGKVKQRNRYFTFYIIKYRDQLLIEKRTGNDIWQGLYQFPMIESSQPFSDTEMIQKAEDLIHSPAKVNRKILCISDSIKHVLSHQVIFAKFVHLEYFEPLKTSHKQIVIDQKNIIDFAFPRLITRYLEKKIN